MAKGSSQKDIGRNRAPRVQLEYDVETFGSMRKESLPFVGGIVGDFAGKAEGLPPAAEREFKEIKAENFDDRMKGIKPRVAFRVPNTLTGEGNLNVDMTFESMSDFAPDAVAKKVEPLNTLLEARTQLKNLLAYMDGKSKAEDQVADILKKLSNMQPEAAADILSKLNLPSPDGDGDAD